MAMMWLSKSFHGVERSERPQLGELSDETTRQYSVPTLPIQDTPSVRDETGDIQVPCQQCEGVGAQQARGKLQLCPECLGTGVLSTS